MAKGRKVKQKKQKAAAAKERKLARQAEKQARPKRKIPWPQVLKYGLAVLIGLAVAAGLSYHYLRIDRPKLNRTHQAVFPDFRPPSIIKRGAGQAASPRRLIKAAIRRNN